MVSTNFNLREIKKEIKNKLRANINTYDIQSRVIEKTSTPDYSSTGYYHLSDSLSYVTSVSVNGTALKYGTEWDIILRNTHKGSVQIISGADVGDTISIVYGVVDSCKSNFIYQDFPRDDLNEESYPRIGFMINFNTTPGGARGGAGYANQNEGLLQIKVVDINTALIDDLIQYVKDYLNANCKNFYTFGYIQQTSVAEYDNYSDNTKKAFSKYLTFTIPNLYECIDFQN